MKAQLMMTVMLLAAMVVDSGGSSATDQRSRPDSETSGTRTRRTPPEYAEWHAYNRRFLTHIRTLPSTLNPDQLKTHLNVLLQQLDFLPTVNAYLDMHLTHVESESQAHTIFTLLDLYSAQEPYRHRYLQEIRQEFVKMFETDPDFVRPIVSSLFFLDGYDRHIRQMKRLTGDLYKRVLVPSAANLDLISYYNPGRLPSLDLALTRHGLPSPFLVMDEEQWYQVRQANAPHLPLSIHLSTWGLTVANHSLRHTHFKFKEVRAPYGGVRYQMKSAVMPDSTHLAWSCQHNTLCFDYQRAAKLEIVGLSDGEVAFVHKRGAYSYFLHSAGIEPADESKVGTVQPRMHHRYPGRSAHWVLVPVTSDLT